MYFVLCIVAKQSKQQDNNRIQQSSNGGRRTVDRHGCLQVQGAICVQPPYVYVQTIAMLVNARI